MGTTTGGRGERSVYPLWETSVPVAPSPEGAPGPLVALPRILLRKSVQIVGRDILRQVDPRRLLYGPVTVAVEEGRTAPL